MSGLGAFDNSNKIILAGPVRVAGDDRLFTKYQAASDLRTFWAANDNEVWYEDETEYGLFDQLWDYQQVIHGSRDVPAIAVDPGEKDQTQYAIHDKDGVIYDSQWPDFLNSCFTMPFKQPVPDRIEALEDANKQLEDTNKLLKADLESANSANDRLRNQINFMVGELRENSLHYREALQQIKELSEVITEDKQKLAESQTAEAMATEQLERYHECFALYLYQNLSSSGVQNAPIQNWAGFPDETIEHWMKKATDVMEKYEASVCWQHVDKSLGGDDAKV